MKEGANFLDILVQPTGTEAAPEEVLVIIDPVHQAIPEAPTGADTPVFLGPDVKSDDTQPLQPVAGTTADKLLDQYRKIGDAQNHVFGEGLPGSTPPNFNLKVPGVNAPAAAPGPTTAAQQPTAKPNAPTSAAGSPKPAVVAGQPIRVPAPAPPQTNGGASIRAHGVSVTGRGASVGSGCA